MRGLKDFKLYSKDNADCIFATLVLCLCGIMVMAVGIVKYKDNIGMRGLGYGIYGILIINIFIYIKSIKSKNDNEKIVLKNKSMYCISYAAMACLAAFTDFALVIIGVIGAIYFFSAFIYYIHEKSTKKPTIIFKNETFIDRATMLSVGEVKYSDIEDVFVSKFNGNKELIIFIKNMEEKITQMSGFKRILNRNKKYIEIPENRVKMPLDQLEILVKKYKNGEFVIDFT